MQKLLNDLQLSILRDLNSLINEIELFPNDTLLWQTLPGITNSAGNIILHICGNLKHFIGSVLGSSGFVSNCEAEFVTKTGTKSELTANNEETIEILEKTFPKISEEIPEDKFPVSIGEMEFPTSRFLIHLSTHLSMHLGQAGYLRRVLTGENKTTNPISLRAISL